MKKNITLLFISLFVNLGIFGQTNNLNLLGTPVFSTSTNNPKSNSNNSVMNGNGSIATTYTQSSCGLGFTQTSAILHKRPFAAMAPPTGTTQPCPIVVSGIPAGAIIQAAFLYAGGSGATGSGNFNATIINPLSVSQIFPATQIGFHTDKCWTWGGSWTSRANVTSIISGNGTYTLSGVPVNTVAAAGPDADGATLFIIYVDPALNTTGSIVIADGCQVGLGGPVNSVIGGFNVCGNPTNTQNFMIVGDLQKTAVATINLNSLVGNLNYPQPLQNAWDFISAAGAPAAIGQTTANYGLTNTGDCYALNMAGMFWQSGPCLTVTAASTPSCPTANATVTPLGGNAPYTYSWTPTAQTTSVAIGLNSGNYTVSVSDAFNCKTGTATLNVTAGATPTISSTGSLSCTNPTTQLSVAPNAATNTILWSGPGIVGPNNTATIVANAAGIYSVTLTSTVCSGTATFNLASGIAPLTLIPSPLSAQICSSSGPITLSVTGAPNYTWSPATSLIPSTGSIVVANPTITTTYTINGVNGVCTGSALVTVSVNPTPTVLITSGNPTLCAGLSTTLTAVGATTYTWNPGNLVGSSVIVNPASTTIYTVIGSNGSCTAAATTTVTIIASPTIATLSSPSSICQGATSSLLAAGALTYTWQPGNINLASITVTPAISTTYTVSGTNAAGCVSSSTLLITVNPNPTITINPSSPTICLGNSTTLTAIGAINYTWTPGGNNTASVSVSPIINTTYTINGNDGICSSSSTVLVTVSANPTVTPSASSATICIGSSATLSAIGATGYTWNPGNLTGTTITVTPISTTVYTVTGSSGLCTDTKTLLITVNNGPTVTVVSSPTTICSASGNSATLTASGALSYTWNPGAAVSSSIIITPTITSTFSVTGVNGLGCVSTTTISFSVTPTPTLIASSTSTAICLGNTVTLNAIGAASYTWSPGAIIGGTITTSPLITTVYTVTGTNGICNSTATIAVVVNANPTITASSSPTVICSGNLSTLTANGALTFTWSPGALTGQTLNVTPATTTNYTVIGTDIAGCTGSIVASVSVNITPTVNPIASPTAICIGNTSTLSSIGAVTYTWNPGNLSGASVTVNPIVNTTYTVVGSTNNCSDTKTVSLIVNPLPTITASSNFTAVCFGNSATLTGVGGTTYTWNPGALIGTNVNVTPLINTTYTVNGTNINGCSNSATVSVIVNANPTITANSSPTVICSGNSSTLSANGALTFTWNPGALVGQTLNVTPATSTNYTVTGTNALGCNASVVASVSVNITPTISPIASPTAICIGNSSTLSSIGATTYTWNPGNLAGTSVTVSPISNTTYTVTGVTNNCFDTKTVSVIVNPIPTITVSTNFTAICSGSSATLTGNGGTTYTWNPGALIGTTVNVTPIINTTYTVTGTNINGCTNTGTVSVNVNANPTITATSNPTIICSGIGATATLSAVGANTYTWSPGNLIGANQTITPTITTTYTVNGTNLSGCSSSKTITIIVAPTPTITIVASPTAICRGNSATLTASGATNYTWFPGGSNNTSIVVSPTVNTTYTVLGNSGTCNSIKTFTLIVRPRPNINILPIPPVICKGATSLLIANGAGNYTWSPSGATGNTIIVSPSVTTVYTVTGSNFFGCTNTAVSTISVNPSPTVITSASSTIACLGSSVTLTSSGALGYSLSPGSQTGSVIIVSPSVTTTYTIIGISAQGCTSTNTITINSGSIPTITASSSATIACNGTSLTLFASGATNYTWAPISLTGSSVVTTVTNTVNTYTVFGETGGCIGVSTLSVLIIDCNNSIFGMTKAAGKPVLVNNSFYNVTFTITATNASTLNLTNVTLNENLNVAFPFPSSFTLVSQPVITSQNSSLTIHPLFDGASQISLTSPSTSTLLANKRDTIVFTVRIDPRGFFGPFYNTVIGFADILSSITVSDSSNNGFMWDPDQDGDPTNNDTLTVINLPTIDLFIPDGFTPDGDGKNDFFFIKGLNGRPIKLTIFNRWGNKVYEKTDYDNSWNGYVNTASMQIGADKVPAATYYYVIEFLDGEKESRTGFVVVQY